MDDLGLEQADHRFGEGVVVRISHTADRRLDAGRGEPLAVFDRDVLDAAIGVMDQAAVERPAGMKRLLQRVEDKARRSGAVCGEHRVLCGDVRVLADVEKLLGGELADMSFTDSPYNVKYSTKDKKRGRSRPILNDALAKSSALRIT